MRGGHSRSFAAAIALLFVASLATNGANHRDSSALYNESLGNLWRCRRPVWLGVQVRVDAIGGGSEEIMLDLASRQANL